MAYEIEYVIEPVTQGEPVAIHKAYTDHDFQDIYPALCQALPLAGGQYPRVLSAIQNNTLLLSKNMNVPQQIIMKDEE
jgi:hypothetical protein